MLTIINIKGLFGVTDKLRLQGEEMSQNGLIENAFVQIENGTIVDFGKMCDCVIEGDVEDAKNGYVMPTFCDSHTHLVYADSREGEFLDRVRGLSYEEIAKRGGGILNSADRLRLTSQEDLYGWAKQRCEMIMTMGTGAVEVKSGYGLNLASELKMLKVIALLKQNLPMTIKATFLGAHAVGREYKGRQREYVDMICREMIPAVAAEGLADFIDVFCDDGFFTVKETDKMLETAAKYGIRPKIHANELAISGGVQVGVKHNALSVDHLERMDDNAINALKGSATMPTALPGASFFLGIAFAPVREMVDTGLGVAIASDFNPGSSPNGNMMFMSALTVIKGRLLTCEAFTAATINSAYAMGVSDKIGSVAKGKVANLIVTKNIPSLDYLVYSYGENCIDKVFINGKII